MGRLSGSGCDFSCVNQSTVGVKLFLSFFKDHMRSSLIRFCCFGSVIVQRSNLQGHMKVGGGGTFGWSFQGRLVVSVHDDIIQRCILGKSFSDFRYD